jgi:hypothetical protein
MKDERAGDSETLVFGDSLTLLRRALPPLGLLMVAMAGVGLRNGQLRVLQALLIAALGIAAAIWAWRTRTFHFRFERASRQVVVRERGPAGAREVLIPFAQVRDVVVRILEGYRSSSETRLGRVMSLQMQLVTDGGEFPLSRLSMQSLKDCEDFERPIWRALGRLPQETLLARSYRHALQERDRLQAIWLRRLMEPSLTLTEAESRVMQDGLGS